VFALNARSYAGRAALVRRFAAPRTWLDVGTGHGHFCTYAQGVFPHTVFDGLDISDAVDEAQRRGWVTTGYRGLFPDLAEKLADGYDVVSMHHYLEHTLDPREELDAAARVVAPGGHLLIEVPDPDWWAGRVLRSYWMPWFQPEHLNLVPLDNLRPALAERGLEVVAVERGRAHRANEFMAAVLLWFNSVLPDPDAPWAARPASRARRAGRALAFTALLPPLLAAMVVDRTLAAAVRRGDGGNCYRVLARRPVPTAPHLEEQA
jgi:SAM-dependent methyltransferase